MDSRIGLDYIVENKEYTEKLAAALDTNNVIVKKQVFELLSALCAYSAGGYQRSLETLQHYKEKKNGRYRFKIIVDELRQAKNQDYQTSLAAFVNCVIISALSIKERISIRNEFMGLKLLDIFNQLRRDCNENGDSDLAVQLDVFDEQKYTDEGQFTGPSSVDLSCHLDVFYAIFRQVSQSPQEVPFLSILQHLLRVDPGQPISDIIWDTTEKLVHRATLCETKEDTEKLLRAPSYHHSLNKFLRNLQESGGRCMCSCHKKECETSGTDGRTRKRTPLQLGLGLSDGTRTPGILSPTNSLSAFSPELLATLSRAISPPPATGGSVQRPMATQQHVNANANVPPPPPPPPISCGPPPPPPPPPPSGCPPPPPPPPGCPPPPLAAKIPSTDINEKTIKLPQQFTPKPKNKMKSLNWTKIPSNKVVGKKNLWSLIAKAHDGSSNDLDFETMEGLFCQQNSSANGQQSPNLSGRERSPTDSLDRKKKESTEINLLDGKRSLNVNIFLKQFRSSNEDIIRLLREGCHEDIGAEKLRGLLKVLPESDEVELLKGFTNERSKLGNAEKFLLLLIELPSYKLRCEAMLLKEDFATNMAFLEPAIGSILSAVQELKQCKELHEILYMLLVAGNFLNSGGYAGDAAGFKMMSLLKIADTRANKPGMNLIHYVAQEANKKFPNLLRFMEFLPSLEDASKLSIDNLKIEITNLSQKVAKVSQQVAKADHIIKQQMEDFLKLAEMETSIVRKDIDNLDKVREEMAEFLCEDAQSFKLEECFKIFHGFCQKFKTSIEENEHRRQQERRAEARRRQREEQLSAKKKNSGISENRPSSFSGSESDNIMDMLLGDIRSGFVHNRFGDHSFKSRKSRKPEPPAELSRMNSLTSSLPSEEDATSSPRVIRRRIGSLNSVVTNGESGEVDSPDITPNGTIRRRRNRLSSEDHDDNLMDFLRQNADGDGTKNNVDKGKSLGPDSGSLDRSVLRRSSRSRRRADILASEFNERERPASPISTPIEKSTELPDAEHNKPRQWRKKIEDWLQENEKEQLRERKFRDRVNLEKLRRQEQEQRELDSAGPSVDRLEEYKNVGKNLETLHEAKTDSELYSNKLKEGPQSSKIDKALTETSQLKDKSKWRKSTLNVANSSESIDDERRRNRSRKSLVDLDSSTEDTISFYIRAPEDNLKQTLPNSINSPALNLESNNKIQSRSVSENTFVNHGLTESRDNVAEVPKLGTVRLEKEPYECNDLKSSNNDVKENVTDAKSKELSPDNNTQIEMNRSKFYQGMREPSFNRVEEELMNITPSDEDQADTNSSRRKTKRESDRNQKTAIQEQNITEPVVPCDEDEGNFDRFSFMRKTTRRTRPKHKNSDSDNSVATDSKSDVVEETQKHEVGMKSYLNSTPDYVESAIKDIGKASQEIQNINEESKRNQGTVYIKNNGGIPRTSDATLDESRKKDKSTSLKARLSRRLHSLTENFKGMLSEGSDKRAVDSDPIISDASDKVDNICKSDSPLSIDSERPSREIPSYERRASIPNSEKNAIMEHRDKVLYGTCVDTRSIPTRFKSEFPQEIQVVENSKPATKKKIEPISPIIPIFPKSPSLSRKLKDEQEKDEGFEETQSQLSEVNSQGAFSSYETDSIDSPKSFRQVKHTSGNVDNKLLSTSPTDTLPTKSRLEQNVTSIIVANSVPISRPQTIPSKVKIPESPSHRPSALCAPTVKRSLSNASSRKPAPIITPSTARKSLSRSLSNGETSKRKPDNATNSNSRKANTEVSDKSRMVKNQSAKSERVPQPASLKKSRDEATQEKIPRGSNDRLPSSKKLNEPIGSRVAAYTRAIRNMTNNINKSNKSFENYDVTQSMPPTPSDADKTFASTLAQNDQLTSQRTRSSSAVNSPGPFKVSSRQSSQRSSPVGSRAGSRRSSERSLDLLSRKSSDRSLNLSRKSSENSVVTVKSTSRKNTSLPRSPVIPSPRNESRQASKGKSSPSRSPLINSKSRLNTPSVRGTAKEKSPVVGPAKSRSLVRRSSSDGGACSFMKATSSSSAKILPTRSTLEQKPRMRERDTKVTPVSNSLKNDIPQSRLRQRRNFC